MDEPDTVSSILLILALLLVNAFFAAAEMAIVSVNKNKINSLAEEGNKKALALKKLTSEPTRFLSTIQVGVTLSGLFASASATAGITAQLDNLLKSIGVPYSAQISMVIVTIILSYFTLVFGELVPKRMALQKSEAISMIAIRLFSFCIENYIAICKATFRVNKYLSKTIWNKNR